MAPSEHVCSSQLWQEATHIMKTQGHTQLAYKTTDEAAGAQAHSYSMAALTILALWLWSLFSLLFGKQSVLDGLEFLFTRLLWCCLCMQLSAYTRTHMASGHQLINKQSREAKASPPPRS